MRYRRSPVQRYTIDKKNNIQSLINNLRLTHRQMFKLLVGALLICFTLSNASAQKGSNSIYSQAIFDYLEYLQKNNRSTDIYIEASLVIEIELRRDSIEDTGITLITKENRKDIYRKNNNRLTHYMILPALTEGERLIIRLIPYHGKRKGKNYDMIVSDGYDLYYKLNKEETRFELDEIEPWGI